MRHVSPPCLVSRLFRADWAVGTFVLQPIRQSVLMSFLLARLYAENRKVSIPPFIHFEPTLIAHHAPDTVLSAGNSFLHSFKGHLLSLCCVPGNVQGTPNRAANDTENSSHLNGA